MNYENIAMMIPSYRRPDRLKKVIDSAIETAEKPERLLFVICVNVNDAETRNYLLERKDIKYQIVDETTLQPNLALYFNNMYEELPDYIDVASELGDDMVFVSKGWDSRITEELKASEGLGIVYFDDDYVAHDKCCVNLFASRKLIDATRKPFMCTFFHADMIDMVWTMVGAMTGLLRYQADMIIRHEHNSKKGQDEWDETFKRLVPVQRVANSKANYRLAIAYSTLVAKNLIDGGIGVWNTLN